MSTDVESETSRSRLTADRLREEVERLVDAAWSQGERAMGAIGIRGAGHGFPPADVVETPTGVVVVIDVPGLSADALDLTLAGNMLTVRGEFPADPVADGSTVHIQERHVGAFKRSFPLPASVDPESIVAECRDGRLQITISKVEAEQARKIPVRSQAESAEETPAPA